MINIPLCSPISMLDNARIAKHDRMGRYIYVHKTIGSYQDIIPNRDATDNSRIDTNPYLVADGRNAFILPSIRLSYNHTFMNITIAPNLGFPIDGNVIGMTYINTPPIWWLADISKPLRFAQMRYNAL